MTQRKSNAKVAVYVGCRYDVVPMFVFPEIKQWVYIDALPDYKAGFKEDQYDTKLETYMNDVMNTMAKVGFKLKKRDVKEKLMVFANGVRECWFFYSTYDPNYTALQKRLMKKAAYLYISAFTPEYTILQLLKPKLTLWIHEMPLYFDFSRKDGQIQFETNKSLSTFLMQNYVNGLTYFFVYDSRTYTMNSIHSQLDSDSDSCSKVKYDIRLFKKIPCTNVLDAAYQDALANKAMRAAAHM